MKKIFRINLTSPSRGVEEFQVVTEDQTHYYAKDSKHIDRKLKKDVKTLAFYNTKLEALQKLLDVTRIKRQNLVSRQYNELFQLDMAISQMEINVNVEAEAEKWNKEFIKLPLSGSASIPEGLKYKKEDN